MSPNELKDLVPLAKTLNAESNEINNTISDLNSKLAALNLGIEVWLGPWEDDPIQIGFAKIENMKGTSWELVTRQCGEIRKELNAFGNYDYEPVYEELGDPEPLLKAPRKTRIEALGLVPSILNLLKKKAEENIETIRNAKKLVAEL